MNNNRTQNVRLLAALLTGTATHKQIADYRKSQEPIKLTLNLGDDENPFEQDPNQPTYHIDVYSDDINKCYDRYPDGRIEYRSY